ncbi:carbonic anhydrase [Aquimarina sp. U1-2]|uniref:carbonic anhydrase n=1 Tax=Aquimarina sp. U1-2 TaxID=2823141 RepID=UPI001AEC827C|nr:carbonic anhydrase [Aquimarina sp. U1-2]MBP2831929.1 carbonic anhydrase [Aquimarina sp. U1-2]
MKKVMYLFTFLLSFSMVGQSKVKTLLKAKDDVYFADRDSAYVDPYYGLRKLIYGNKRFAENKSISPRQTDADLKNNQLGQKPFATIIGCADSRVPNEIIFDQGVGDLFITRTAGQVMAEASYGTIEYATVALNTKLIVVLGHESCGAVDAAMKLPENPPGHVVSLINAIKPSAIKAKEANLDDTQELDLAVRSNVVEQVNLLRNLEPILSRKFDKGEVLIVGAIYNLSSGKVEFIEETITSLPKFKQNIKG